MVCSSLIDDLAIKGNAELLKEKSCVLILVCCGMHGNVQALDKRVSSHCEHRKRCLDVQVSSWSDRRHS